MRHYIKLLVSGNKTILSGDTLIILVLASLVIDRQNVPWSKKQRRSYHRILSGINRTIAMGVRLRVMTLTSAPDSPRGVQLSKNFQTLRKRIIRKFKTKFEYWRLRTNEGNGVLHVLFRGCYIPHSWLKRQWEAIHGARIVFIQAVGGRSKNSGRRLAGYMVGHYLSSHTVFMRQSWSWGWIFYKFKRIWVKIIRESNTLKEAITKWNIVIRQRNPYEWYISRNKKRWRDFTKIKSLSFFVLNNVAESVDVESSSSV